MTLRQGAVSVIIPAYNVSGMIGRAIRSAAAQPLQQARDSRGRRLLDRQDRRGREGAGAGNSIPSRSLNSRHGGPSAARDLGLRAAKADWIALLNSDDGLEPGRLKRLSEAASATSADFVADNLVMWDPAAQAPFKPLHRLIRGEC
jgi:succinoglycan biosynthesis protein ExoO